MEHRGIFLWSQNTTDAPRKPLLGILYQGFRHGPISLSHSSSRSGFSMGTNFWNLWPNREMMIERRMEQQKSRKVSRKRTCSLEFQKNLWLRSWQKTSATELTYNKNTLVFIAISPKPRTPEFARYSDHVHFLGDATLNNMVSKRFVESSYLLGCHGFQRWYRFNPFLDVFPCSIWKNGIFFLAGDCHNSHHFIYFPYTNIRHWNCVFHTFLWARWIQDPNNFNTATVVSTWGPQLTFQFDVFRVTQFA